MYKTVIIENDVKQLSLLKRMIRDNCPLLDVAAYVTDVRSVKKILNDTKPELVIVNTAIASLPEFKFIESKISVDFECIFISKGINNSLRDNKNHSVEYLFNPIKPKGLQLVIKKVIQKILDKAFATQKDLILHNTIAVSNNSLQKLAIPTFDGLIFIHLDDIVRFESYGTYTYIYTVKKEKIIASRNIKEFEDILPKNQFFRIHNSHLININRLIKYNKGRGGTITMEDGTRIEVASRRKIDFLNLFQH